MKEMVVVIGDAEALLEELTRGLRGVYSRVDVPHFVWHGRYASVVEIGERCGWDASGRTRQKKVLAFLEGAIHPRIIAADNTLASLKFFHAVEDAGWQLQVFYLDGAKVPRGWTTLRIPELPLADQALWLQSQAIAPVKALG